MPMRMSNKQKEFWKNANHRWNIKEGAVRSGKTYLDYYLIPKRILSTKGEGIIALLGNSRASLERNILTPMREIWGSNNVGTIKPDGSINLFGKKCFAFGADKITQKEKLQGTGIEYCYGDEITTWNEEVFQMLKSRLDKPHSIFDGTCNPDGPEHWLLKFLESDADIFRQTYTLYDNPFLDEKFVKSLETEYRDSVYFDRFILGKWTRAEGLVYPMFSKTENLFKNPPKDGKYYISVDYGTVNPTSFGLWCLADGIGYRIAEYYYDSKKTGKRLTDEEYYEKLCKLAGNLDIEYVVIDPSAASFITLIKKHGRFSVRRANNSVLDGIRYTAGLIKAKRIMISPDCHDILQEFSTYCWDETAETDKVIKQNDHAMDEMRYFCTTIIQRFCP